MWCIYLLECSDGTYYCGITNDLPRRLKQHLDGKASKYTRTRLPVKCIAYIKAKDRSEASKIEYQVKQQPREKKLQFLLTKGNSE